MYAYKATKYTRGGMQVNCVLSASWETYRDACLAAKIAYGLTLGEFNVLVAEGKVKHRGTTIQVDGAEILEAKGLP